MRPHRASRSGARSFSVFQTSATYKRVVLLNCMSAFCAKRLSPYRAVMDAGCAKTRLQTVSPMRLLRAWEIPAPCNVAEVVESSTNVRNHHMRRTAHGPSRTVNGGVGGISLQSHPQLFLPASAKSRQVAESRLSCGDAQAHRHSQSHGAGQENLGAAGFLARCGRFGYYLTYQDSRSLLTNPLQRTSLIVYDADIFKCCGHRRNISDCLNGDVVRPPPKRCGAHKQAKTEKDHANAALCAAQSSKRCLRLART
jgi:hypothetical protein